MEAVDQLVELIDWSLLSTTSYFGVSVPLSQLKIFFCLLLAFPSSFLFRLLPNSPNLKHFIGGITGLFFGYYTFGAIIAHTALSSSVAYAILVVFDVKKGLAHKLVFLWTIVYLSLIQFWRVMAFFDHGNDHDVSGPQMLLTIKLTTLAFDYYDGLRAMKGDSTLTDYQKKFLFQGFPTFLEFFGYIYHFNGFLAGPVLNFKEYREYIDMSMYKSNGGKIPRADGIAWNRWLQSLLIAVIVILGGRVSLSFIDSSDYYALNFFQRFAYLWIATSLARAPYYFAWTSSEAACTVSGLAYSGNDSNGRPTWNRAQTVKILRFELAQNLRDNTESWNIRTDKWLKHYIYERVPGSGVFTTFLCSSIWHGFFPGYYLSFLSAAPAIFAMRYIRRNIRSRFMEADGVTPKPSKKIYDILTLIGTSTVLNYMMCPFKLLEFQLSLRAWASVYYYGHVATALAVVVALLLGSPRRPRKTEGNGKEIKAN
eukprot:TRINITY_DN4288_c0_g1_i1.p1 TRINITY_DN4288_c0_g1~~TRINITY_DN4288_c0_g1_i1.p1  ORF type:complete len:482 (-),score=156.76 TRINITY_DN4288_c0_g1_i1:22-1467(-)